MKETILELQNITKQFGDTKVLNGISLCIGKGEFITLLGASGCGKTTTLRIIAGLETPDQGKVVLAGKDVTDTEPNRRDVNTVFQNYALFPHMTVAANIGYSLKLKKRPKEEIQKTVGEALALVQLTGYEKRMPSELSGGQKQRVAIARALVNQPSVLLLDEPLGALDLQLRRQMQLELKQLQKRLGLTFIYITHDQEEALNMSDRIVVMKDGFIQQVDTPQNLYEYPVNEFVAGFMGSPQMNFIDAKLGKNGNDFTVTFGNCTITVPAKKAEGTTLANYVGKDIVFGIRPEDVHDEPDFIQKVGGAHVTCDVEVTELMGAETYLYLNCEGSAVTARVEPTSTAKPGDKCKVAFDLNKMHIFDKETEVTVLN